jgi:cytidylate kinase
MKRLLITIDGPAGAGKTTVSRRLADHLGYTYIDTGALYRGVAFEAGERGIPPDDERQLDSLCRGLALRFVRNENGTRLFSGEKDITDRIRTPEMSMLASAVSALPVVRRALLDVQRKMGAEKAAVFEGRDMGTVVFPDADLKFFLTADLKARAFRRYKELAGIKPQPLEGVEMDMKRRDENDSTRDVAPLKPAGDAIIIDSTDIPADAVVEQMVSHVEKKIAGR